MDDYLHSSEWLRGCWKSSLLYQLQGNISKAISHPLFCAIRYIRPYAYVIAILLLDDLLLISKILFTRMAISNV